MSNVVDPAASTLKAALDAKIASIISGATASLGQSKAAVLAPILTQYAPVFAGMAETEITQWIQMAINGSPYDAYMAIVNKLPPDDLVNEWAKQRANWQSQNQANAAVLAYQHAFAGALLQAFAAMALASVGL